MATQYSNKPIVTNGLVYALDFGNQKSYVSGSSSARSLKFGSVTGSILTFGGASIPNLQNGLLKMVAPTATTGSTINTLQQFSDLVPDGDFTIQILGTFPASDMFITQGPSATRLISNGNGMLGWYLNPTPYVGGTTYKTYTKSIPSGLKHITYRYSSGSYDMFVNGIPVPTTARNQITSTNAGTLTINGYGTLGLSLATQDLGNFYIYSRALTSDEIYSNYLIQAQRYGLPTTPKPYTIDENAYLFLSQSGITDPIITSSINTFVLGLKSASLWDKMIAIYPFVGTGSVGVNLTGSQSWNLKEPTSAFYRLAFTGSWNGSTSGSTPSGSNTSINTGVLPFEYYPFKSDSNQHISILSYDTPTSSSFLAGTGIDTETAVSTLAGDYGTPAAAYSVRKVRTAYSGALMDVRRSYDNTTGSIGYVSNGDLDTGSLLDWVVPGRSTLPGAYSGLAAAYSLRRVSGSYTGSAIDVRRIWDNTTSSIGFDVNGNLDTGSLLNFTTSGSNGIVYSNDFTQGVWTKYNSQITSSAIIGPFGLGSGSFLNEITTGVPTGLHALDYNINPANTSSLHTISGFVKKQERRYVGLGFGYDANRGITTIFDLDTTASVSSGSVGTGFSVVSSSINYVTDGWFRISLTGTTGLTDLFPRFFLVTSSAQLNSPYPNYVAEPGTGSYIYGFQYTTGSTVQPYIETTGTARYNVGNTSSFGYVTQWYDQSGNNKHLIQVTSSKQPLIVSSGSLILESGSVGVRFDGTDDTLVTTTTFTQNQPITTFGVWKVPSNKNIVPIYGFGATTYIDRIDVTQFSTNKVAIGSTGGAGSNFEDNHILTSSINLNQYYLASAVYNTPNFSFTLNNTTNTTSSALNTQNLSDHYFSIGNWFFFGYTAATVKEVLVYFSDQSANRPLIENNINNYYSIYTGSNNGFVARWYDQSGNNNHATQTATGSQPLIVLSGSVINDNSRVGIYFDDSTFLERSAINVTQVGQYTVYTPYGDTRYSVWGQEVGDAYWYYAGGTGYIDLFGGANTNNRREGYPTGVPSSGPTLFSSFHEGNNMTTFINNSNRGTDSTQPFSATGNVLIGRQKGGSTYSLSGSIKEIVVYNSADTSTRSSIEYGINNYYNIYTQPSASFTTSSFTIKATPTGITGAINNQPLNGISSTGPVGFITVSRTGSNALTIARNGVTSSFTVPASGALSTGIYLGASNYNGITVGSSPLGISFASVGVGLSNSDTITLNGLVSELQGNLNTDADATAFIQAAGLTGSYLDSTKIPSAITFLTQNLKRYGLWTKMRAIYPFVGNNQNSHRINLKSPSLYPLNYGSGYTFSTQNGSVPGATITGFNMGINANTILSPNSGSIGFYTPTNVARNGWAFGNGQFTLMIALYGASNLVYYDYTDTVSISRTPVRGFYAMSKTGSFVEGFYNSTRIYSGSQSTGSISGTMTFGTGQGTTSDAAFTFGYVADSLTTSDVQNLYSIVQSYQTILGRQV